MPVAKSPQFRRRALELVDQGEPVAQVAKNLGISESCLPRWRREEAIDAGVVEGLTSDERRELAELRRKNRVLEMEVEILKRASAYFARENVLPKTGFRCVEELAEAGFPVAVARRVLKVSRSGFYEWRDRPASRRTMADRELMVTIRKVHRQSRGTYGALRVHGELRLGLGVRCGRKRVARLMRADGLQGVCHPRKGGHLPLPATHDDLVQRQFHAEGPDRLWFTDITQHRAAHGWVYCCAVIDAWSRRILGWAIADHIRTELVVDALQMARWQRRPPPGTIVHPDRGSQYTSWLFGHRLRQAGLLGSMGWVASSQDNAAMESFWSSMQRELLDRRSWPSKQVLATAMFEWIEGWSNPPRRHCGIGMLSPHEFETLHAPAATAA